MSLKLRSAVGTNENREAIKMNNEFSSWTHIKAEEEHKPHKVSSDLHAHSVTNAPHIVHTLIK